MNNQVLILNYNGGIVFQGEVKTFNHEQDQDSGCKIANCIINKQTISVWKIDDKWQGWI